VRDAVQEAFIKTYVNIQSFDPVRRFSPWIYRIAHNTFVNSLRTRQRRPVILFDADTILPRVIGKHPESELDRTETLRLLETGVTLLEPKYREPLVLFYYNGLSYEEISDVLRIPRSTVGVRISRGREKLRQSLSSTVTA